MRMPKLHMAKIMKRKEMKMISRGVRRAPGKFLAIAGVALASLFFLWRMRRRNSLEMETIA